ncbi:Ubiquitin carboxyl-terminal hydrolase 34 [Phytophthora pseudosyringae]|uniref:ubiquitinyl hydrolase 1 n=1 Tax=Phytophthora pseudosyringae TaxID=221518 RepID=A0A8T1VKZ9_9STRA|nr:Ubiquitin carboxyl-terminal hydrolase 34 [Phytophthora pseudosyringae]
MELSSSSSSLRVATEDVVQVAEELRRDFDGTCVAIASELAACDDPTHWLELLRVLVRGGREAWELSPELAERLDGDLVPQVTQLLLGKSFELAAVEAVNQFLQWTLATVKACLARGDLCRLSCLARVLDAHRRFYLYHGTSNDRRRLLRSEEDSDQALRFTVRGSSLEYTSQYFLRNLEYWGELDGFSVFLDVLHTSSSFEALQCILRTLYDVKDHLHPEFLMVYFPKLIDAVCALVHSLEPSEFYALSRDSLLEVVQVMELLLAKIQHDVDVAGVMSKDEQVLEGETVLAREICEQRVQLLRLEISLRFFRSSSLEKRIYGLTEIVVIMTRLYNDQIQEQAEPTAVSLYATLSYLVDWMHKTQLMQELLGEKMHVELIKRSTSLFQFASELEVLPTAWIDLVWTCYHHTDSESGSDDDEPRPVQQRHEAFRSTIHDLLLEMVTFMEPPSLVHLVRRIEAVKARLDSNQLGLFAAIAARRLLVNVPPELFEDATASPSTRSLRQRILLHLWAAVLPSAKSEDFRDEVLLRMHEMLRLEAAGDDSAGESEGDRSAKECAMVDEFLWLCLDNISRREDLAMSLKLFTQLSSLVGEVGIMVSDPRQSSKAYVHLLLNETVEYKQNVRRALKSSEWAQLDDDERAKLPMLQQHVSEIKNRLLALRAAWILDESGDANESSFTDDKLNSLWELMVVDAFLLDEAALCFQWIELCMNTPLQARTTKLENENGGSPRALLPLHMAEYLLTTKFSSLPGECITLSTLCCFHSIFRRINVLRGGLKIFSAAADPSRIPSPTGRTSSASSSDGDKEESVELMTGRPLVGLDELWQLAVKATDAAVAEEIITLLASFHLAFAPDVRQTELPFQCKMRFLDKCMEFIATAKADAEWGRSGAADSNDSSKLAADVAVVNRCVDLLRYFLEACKVGDDSAAKEAEDAMLQKLESEGSLATAGTNEETTKTRKRTFRLEHLEERLPYLEIYPSPMKDAQSDSTKSGYRTGRRPSWTFRQQHALLDVIVDSNEEAEVEDTPPVSRPSETDKSPLKVDLREDLLKTASPIKSTMRSPCVRANLRWPEAPSPQRGPDFRPEDIDQALTDFTSRGHELHSIENEQEGARGEAGKDKTRYGLMSQILANEGSHFDVLLELVDWDESTSQRTWDLLCRLPTNNELLRKMIRLRSVENGREALGEANWSDLLDGSNVHRLLYALRLVEALLIPIEPAATGGRELNSGRRQWRERFVRLGGATHLYETLLKWPEEHSIDGARSGDSIASQYAQNIRATCLAATMRVLNYFFYWSRLTGAEKLQHDQLSPFDVRLQSSTLPEFVKAVALPSMLQVAVQLTARFSSQNSDKEASFSDEAAEAVYCGVRLCCSLIRFAPHLTVRMFEADSDTEASFSGGASKHTSTSITMSGWLKALLVDCPSKPTRAQVLGALSEMATAFGIVDSSTPARALFEPLVVSACYLVSDGCLGGVYRYSALEELFTFCRVLLGCCGRVQTRQATRSETSSDANDTLAAALVQTQIPCRLVRNLCRIVSHRQVAATTRRIGAPRNEEEGILGGYLQLLALLASISEKTRTAILHHEPRISDKEPELAGDMIRLLHTDLLFGDKVGDLDVPRPVICRTSSTRHLAQRLLLNLVFPRTLDRWNGVSGLNDDMLVLLDRLDSYQARVLESVNLAGRQWNYAPADSFLDVSTRAHHAGLVNPGCICYMNSLVQQLFMMPTFCGGLLGLDCSQIVPDRSSSSWKEEVEQLQKLFVSLAYTNYRSSDPTSFARSHKDMDGNTTDVNIQMDADEFFSLLLDRLEMFIRTKATADADEEDSKANPDGDFMAQCFGGVLVNQILTQQGNLSEREEKFFALSLEVSKKRHLAESLGLYVQGETLEGENAYFCERAQRKVSATKRVCIKTLPQTLVCHLKRFEFDYDTMEKVKINDYLEFPMELDMFPYTSEALAATDGAKTDSKTERVMMYDLVGVVVHSGTSDTGHYYSFIKDRHDTENQRWLEFNDEVVREFEVEIMGEECFGGEEVAQKWDAIQGTYCPIVQMKRRSAYMLIYERRSAEEGPGVTNAAGTLTLSSQVQALATRIMQENARYEGVVNAFDPTYEKFIRDLMENATRVSVECSPAVARQACQLGSQFLFGISSLRCRSAALSPTSSPHSPGVSSYYQISARVALWLAGYDESPSSDFDDERVHFSKWILAEVVAPPTTSEPKSPPTALPQLESQRTWLFDVLFLTTGGQELGERCFQVLLAAVSVLAHEAVAENGEAEQSLVAFFRESLNLFYSREPHLDVCDPGSGCVLTLSMETRVPAMKQLGAFLDQCISESIGDATASSEKRTTAELSTIRLLFLEKLQFLNHFLLTLQTPCEISDVIPSSAVPSRGIAPLAIETRSATPLREHDLRLCTLQLEMKLLKHLLASHEQPESLSMDSTLLLSHAALKNVVLFGLEETLLPILTRILFESEASLSKYDRLVALLIGVLEEVKDTHADKVLAVFGRLLDEEEARSNVVGERSEAPSLTWTVHQHVFSPTRGLLESVTYYRDHGSHEYTFLLLEFVVRRASASLVLQELFKCDPKSRYSVSWIPQWLVDHLDANGAIRKQMRANDGSDCDLPTSGQVEGVEEVQKLFIEAEKAFGIAVPVYCEDMTHDEEQGLLISPPISPSALAADDILLEALDLDNENQQDKHSDQQASKHGARQLGKNSAGEMGPEHEGANAGAHESSQANRKLHRSRDELSMFLRIDLDTTQNNAREA